MGEMADYYMDRDLDRWEDEVCDGTWTTREGETLKISDMETSHIQNCIRMITRTGMVNDSYLDAFREELDRRNNG